MADNKQRLPEKVPESLKQYTKQNLEKMLAKNNNLEELEIIIEDKVIPTKDGGFTFPIHVKIRKNFINIVQSQTTDAIINAVKQNFTLLKDKDTGVSTDGDIRLTLENFSQTKLNVPTSKIFDILLLKIAAQNVVKNKVTLQQIEKSRFVELDVEEYMRRCNLKDRKEAKKKLSEAANALGRFSVDIQKETCYIEKNDKKKREKIQLKNVHMNLMEAVAQFDSYGKKYNDANQCSKVVFAFSSLFIQYLCTQYIMPFPRQLLTINSNKNPYSYNLGRKLAAYFNMNLGKPNQNIISVRNLAKIMNISLKTTKHISQQIIQPFERDIDALVDIGVLKKWEYCNSKREPLTSRQLKSNHFNDWLKQYVFFELSNCPTKNRKSKKHKRSCTKSSEVGGESCTG